MGKLHFWLLPNLTADCGFFESFVPVYEYSVYKNEDKNNSDEKSRDSGSPSDGDGVSSPPSTARLNDSEESGSLSGKENEDWVKVKKDDADGLNENGDEN